MTVSEIDDEDESENSSRTKDEVSSQRPWRTTYASHGWSKAAEDEREKERKNNIARALSLSVPKVGRGKHRNSRHTLTNGNNQGLMLCAAKVDQIPRRRTENSCRLNQERQKFVNHKYRPPCFHPKSSDEEKQRLTNLFGTRGGKCLPEDLTCISSADKDASGAQSLVVENAHPPANTMFDQIYQEILERRQYQMDLEEIGAGDATRDQIANEIRVRVEHLKKIDPIRATMTVQRLMQSS